MGLAALGHERRKALGLGLAQVEVIGQPGLAAGEPDREPPGARAEGRDRIDQGRNGIACRHGIASTEFRHAYNVGNWPSFATIHGVAKTPLPRGQTARQWRVVVGPWQQ
jgi:hypothetical protein